MSVMRKFLAVLGLVAVIGGFGVVVDAVAAGAQTTTTTTAPGTTGLGGVTSSLSEESSGKLRTMLMGGVLFCVAAIAPFTLMKLIPFAEGIEALEGTSRSISSLPMRSLMTTSSGMNVAGKNLSSLFGKGKAAAAAATPGGGGPGGGSPGGGAASALSTPGSASTTPGSSGAGSGSTGSGASGGGAAGGAGRVSRLGQWAKNHPAKAGSLIAPGFGTVAGLAAGKAVKKVQAKRATAASFSSPSSGS